MSTEIAIIGGGLAGTACAYRLKQAGFAPVIYEAQAALATKASGNAIGLYNPRFTAEFSAVGQYYSHAFKSAFESFETLTAAGHDIGWSACGALHLINDEKKARRFSKMLDSWGWGSDAMRIVSKKEAAEIAHAPITHNALYLRDAGYVSPPKLCAAYAQDIEIVTSAKMKTLQDIDAEIIIIANGRAANMFAETRHLPLKTVRGQVTRVRATEDTASIRCNIQYGGYLSPPITDEHGTWHMLGSSFQRWLDHENLIDQDNADNIAKLAENVPDLANGLDILDARAGVRTAAPDHMPIAGHLHDHLYISTAHGSHGIVSSIASAELITQLITGQPPTLPEKTVEAISPLRYKQQ